MEIIKLELQMKVYTFHAAYKIFSILLCSFTVVYLHGMVHETVQTQFFGLFTVKDWKQGFCLAKTMQRLAILHFLLLK